MGMNFITAVSSKWKIAVISFKQGKSSCDILYNFLEMRSSDSKSDSKLVYFFFVHRLVSQFVKTIRVVTVGRQRQPAG